MKHVELKCKNCGSELKIDTDGTYFCPYCGSRYEKNQDNIQYVNNNIQNITKNIYSSELGIEEYLENGETFLSLDEWGKAEEAFNKAVDLAPADCRGWFGLVKVYTGDLTMAYPTEYEQYYIKAMRVANDEDRQTMLNIMQDYYQRVKGNLYPYEFPDEINFMDKTLLKRRHRIHKAISDKKIKSYSIFTILLGVALVILGIVAGILIMFLEKDTLTLESNFRINSVEGYRSDYSTQITGKISNRTDEEIDSGELTIFFEVADNDGNEAVLQFNVLADIDEGQTFDVDFSRNTNFDYNHIVNYYYEIDHVRYDFNQLNMIYGIVVLAVFVLVGLIVILIGLRLPNRLEKRNSKIIDRAKSK